MEKFLARYDVDSEDTHENEDSRSERLLQNNDHSDNEADISTMASDDLYEWIKNTIQTLADLENLEDITACQIQQVILFLLWQKI